ncbi:universal stress protein [Streptomyces spectabilis]|uniref:Universal stress protein n=1 Tax=Streptomyces spectabilis TaxID=68270 RepID=A0A516RIJ7_STRST|nr:universal stress protein [Streptomyces spectabilis]QDQ15480.1 universal stress protein [Streptomyces spectabilis]
MKHNRTPSPSGTRSGAAGPTVPRVVTVGIDGSYASMDAADWAAREALRHRVPLRLVHAGTPPARPVGGRRVLHLADRARGVLDRAAITLAYVHPALEIHAQQPCGPAVPALLSASTEAESLVLGSRGLSGPSGFAGFLVGSVAAGVAARAERPVVLVRAGERPEDAHVPDAAGEPSRGTPYRPVVLGVDVEDPAGAAFAYAFAAAAARGAPLHAVHAWTVGRPTAAAEPTDLPGLLRVEAAARERLTTLLRPWRHAYPQVKVVEEAVFGRPGHHLLKASLGASLLVVGRRVTPGPHLGGTAHSVVHRVSCPVAVVPYGTRTGR